MGWTYTNRYGTPAKDFIIENCLTWTATAHKYTVLDSAILNMRVMYAAVERIEAGTGKRDVWAAVILLDLKKGKDGCDIGWKAMDESCGPNEADCPERILKLLTDTDSKYAQDWRERCRANIARRKAVGEFQAGQKVTVYGKMYVLGAKVGRNWHAASLHDGRTYKLTPKVLADVAAVEAAPEQPKAPEPVHGQANLFEGWDKV